MIFLLILFSSSSLLPPANAFTFYSHCRFFPFFFLLWVKAINNKSCMKGRTTEENPMRLENTFFSWTACGGPGRRQQLKITKSLSICRDKEECCCFTGAGNQRGYPHRRHPPWWYILTGLSSPFGGAFSQYLLSLFFSRHVLKPNQRKEQLQRPPQPEGEASCPRRSPQPPALRAAHAPLRAQRRSFGFFCSWLFPTQRHGALCSSLAFRFWLCIPAAGICNNSGGFCVSQILNN